MPHGDARGLHPTTVRTYRLVLEAVAEANLTKTDISATAIARNLGVSYATVIEALRWHLTRGRIVKQCKWRVV